MKLAAVLLFLTGLFGFACTKEEGPAGPVGPQGNANVKTVVFNTQPTDWQYDFGSAFLEKPLPEITADIYNKGSMDVYWHIDNNWVALPFSYPSDSVIHNIGFGYKTGNLKIFITKANGTTPVDLNTATFKAVITAGQ